MARGHEAAAHGWRWRPHADYAAPEAEAARGLPRLLNIGFHLGICDRPARFPAFRDTLRALAARGDRSWLARRDAIARAFASAMPAVHPCEMRRASEGGRPREGLGAGRR